MEKYTYDNWWNGEVTLNYARKVWTKEDAPIIVEWLNFDEGDVACFDGVAGVEPQSETVWRQAG